MTSTSDQVSQDLAFVKNALTKRQAHQRMPSAIGVATARGPGVKRIRCE